VKSPNRTIILAIILACNLVFIYGQNDIKRIIPGAERLVLIKPAIKNKVIAVVANHTSVVGQTHLVDTLLSIGVKIKKIFCPEHGFRGIGSEGEFIKSSRDIKTGIPIVSLYGNKKKPTAEDLAGVDVVLYDLQDVGVRCYTYISTMTYVMQACAENFIPFFVLDRPNPNGFYIDGPVLDKKNKSFVGLHPIPLVYAMTPGELATMINEEEWLGTVAQCGLGVIPCQNYSHKLLYELPINPSPNLPNMCAVYLYPSLCLFEGTSVNVARGTDFPFQAFGSPDLNNMEFTYTPVSIPNKSKKPVNMGLLCKGMDLRHLTEDSLINKRQVNLAYLVSAFENCNNKKMFFNSFFKNLAGTDLLQSQITNKLTPDSIRKTWQPDIEKFKAIRKKYLIYEDFE
jgi:uncharacterized protein YbbC (DUF1343 family)